MKRKEIILTLGFICAIICTYSLIYSYQYSVKEKEFSACIAASDYTDTDCYECEVKIYDYSLQD